MTASAALTGTATSTGWGAASAIITADLIHGDIALQDNVETV